MKELNINSPEIQQFLLGIIERKRVFFVSLDDKILHIFHEKWQVDRWLKHFKVPLYSSIYIDEINTTTVFVKEGVE